MRIWSLHPEYLDVKGLVALWRETLLAKQVLEGKTKGYKNHPQLNRFKKSARSLDAINQYLITVFEEATNRNYNFDKQKINWDAGKIKLAVTQGQLDYEAKHLLQKLKQRDPKKYSELKSVTTFKVNPLFKVIAGGVEEWEIIN